MSNYPAGVTTQDPYFGEDSFYTEKEARAELKELLIEEGMKESEVTEDVIDEFFDDNYKFSKWQRYTNEPLYEYVGA